MTPGFNSQALLETLGGGNFILRRALSYTTMEGLYVEIPADTVTDFASSYVCGGYINFLPRPAQFSRAGLLHDAIYRNTARLDHSLIRSRLLADQLFREALELDNLPSDVCRRAYRGVRLFGRWAYKQ